MSDSPFKRLQESIKRHPFWWAVAWIAGLMFATVLPAISGVWALGSDRPLLETLVENRWGWLIVGPLYGWLVLLLWSLNLAALFTILGATLRREREPRADSGTAGELRTLRLDLQDFDQDILRILVSNDGPTDSFAVQVFTASGLSGMVYPFMLRWKDSVGDTRQIVSGHSHHIEVLRAPHDQNPETGEFSLHHFLLLTPAGEVSASPLWWVPNVATQPVLLIIDVTSTTSGASVQVHVLVDVTVTGKTALRAPMMRGPVKRLAVIQHRSDFPGRS